MVYMILQRLGVHENTLRVLMSLHDDCEFYVQYNGQASELFWNLRGFREGGPGSPVCYNVLHNLGIKMKKAGLVGVDFRYDS